MITFTAQNTNTRLRWDDYGHLDANGDTVFDGVSRAELVLDGVELHAVPEAGTPLVWPVLMGGAAWLLRRRRLAGAAV